MTNERTRQMNPTGTSPWGPWWWQLTHARAAESDWFPCLAWVTGRQPRAISAEQRDPSGGMWLGWASWKEACMNKLTPSALLRWSLTSPETIRKPKPFLTSKERAETNSMASSRYFWTHWEHNFLLWFLFIYLFMILLEPGGIYPKVLKVMKMLNHLL